MLIRRATSASAVLAFGIGPARLQVQERCDELDVVLDPMLANSISNASVCFARIACCVGYPD